MKIPFTGGCVCGAVRYQCDTSPIAMLKCHCRDCQRVSGAPHVCAILVPVGAFRFTQGLPRYHHTPSEAGGLHQRGFCAECGSRLTGGEDPANPRNFIGITAGSLDDPSWFNAEVEFWTCDAQPWDPPRPDLPHFETSPPES